MDYEDRPFGPQNALGYSWFIGAERARELEKGKDVRYRVCVRCLTVGDHPDVKVVHHPAQPSRRPKCDRCGAEI